MKPKLTELKGEINSLIVIVGDFHTSCAMIDRINKMIRKETEDLNNT